MVAHFEGLSDSQINCLSASSEITFSVSISIKNQSKKQEGVCVHVCVCMCMLALLLQGFNPIQLWQLVKQTLYNFYFHYDDGSCSPREGKVSIKCRRARMSWKHKHTVGENKKKPISLDWNPCQFLLPLTFIGVRLLQKPGLFITELDTDFCPRIGNAEGQYRGGWESSGVTTPSCPGLMSWARGWATRWLLLYFQPSKPPTRTSLVDLGMKHTERGILRYIDQLS